jgi:hypothetical protein
MTIVLINPYIVAEFLKAVEHPSESCETTVVAEKNCTQQQMY